MFKVFINSIFFKSSQTIVFKWRRMPRANICIEHDRYVILYTFIFSASIFVSCKQQTVTLFTDITSSSGIDFSNDITETENLNVLSFEYMYNGGCVAAGDLNGDGLPDLYFTGNQVANKLYLNKSNLQFEDITDKAGVSGKNGWKTGVTMADVNGDGLLDIYVCYSGKGDYHSRSNQLFINNGLQNGVPLFKEETEKYGVDAAGTNSTQAIFFDYDRDGDLDMFLLNHATMFYSPFFNTDKLRKKRHPYFSNRYRNDTGHFTDVSESAGIKGGGNNFGLGVCVSDLNGDGWPDIYATNDFEEQDFLYLNNHDGTFGDATKKSLNHISKNGEDAGKGFFLKYEGMKGLKVERVDGIKIDGDVRDIALIKTKTGKKLIVVAKNRGHVQVVKH